MDEYGDVLYNLYGSTEASWVCIATPEDLAPRPRHRRHASARARSSGSSTPTTARWRRARPAGSSAATTSSSRATPPATTKDFVDGLVSTGDMGHEKDGLFFVDGRDDDMIVSGGENVYPVEVESLLVEHPAVREVSVVGVPDPEFGQRLAAFVALRDGARLTADEVKDHVRANRARHCVPREVHFVDELPRNATGKVLARELRDRLT